MERGKSTLDKNHGKYIKWNQGSWHNTLEIKINNFFFNLKTIKSSFQAYTETGQKAV